MQNKDGFTRIDNELLELITRYPFTKRELKVVLAVIRITCGFNKKMDRISVTQLSNMTGLSRGNVAETVPKLGSINVLKIDETGYIRQLGLNKDYLSWGQTDPETGTVEEDVTDPETGTVADKSDPVLEKSDPETGSKVFPIQEPQKKERKKQKKGTGSKASPVLMFETWRPIKKNMDWLIDSGLAEFQISNVIAEFKDFWILSGSKKANWDSAFRRNPKVKHAVNLAKRNKTPRQEESEPWRDAL